MSTATKSSYKQYLSFFAGQLFSIIGSMTIHFAIIWWITVETGSATLLSLAATISFVPLLVMIPIAGVYCDIWDRKKVIIISDLLQALTTLCIIISFISGNPNIWFVVGLNGLRGIFQAFHSPASNAIIPLMIPKENLSRMNGMRFASFGMVSILSPIIASALMAVFTIQQILWVDIITFGLAMIPMFFIKIPKIQSHKKNKQKSSFTKELKLGFKTVVEIKGLNLLMIWSLLINFVLRPFHVLLPYYVNITHSGSVSNFALVMIMSQIGWVLGSIIASTKKNWKNKGAIVLYTAVIACIGNIIVAFAPQQAYWVIGLGRLICTAMISWGVAVYYTILQISVPLEKQGRIYSFDMFISNLIAPIAMGISGPIADLIGIVPYFAIIGILGIFINVIMHAAGMGKLKYNEIEENKINITSNSEELVEIEVNS